MTDATAAPEPTALPSTQPAPAAHARASEDQTTKYLRETRNAVTFIAWIVGLFALASLIIGIIMGVQLAHLNTAINNANNGASVSSNCESQGGTNPSC
jgi:hypothetical protein